MLLAPSPPSICLAVANEFTVVQDDPFQDSVVVTPGPPGSDPPKTSWLVDVPDPAKNTLVLISATSVQEEPFQVSTTSVSVADVGEWGGTLPPTTKVAELDAPSPPKAFRAVLISVVSLHALPFQVSTKFVSSVNNAVV